LRKPKAATRCTAATRRAQPLPNVFQVRSDCMKANAARRPCDQAVDIGALLGARAASPRRMPSTATPSARCSHLIACAGPEFTAPHRPRDRRRPQLIAAHRDPVLVAVDVVALGALHLVHAAQRLVFAPRQPS